MVARSGYSTATTDRLGVVSNMDLLCNLNVSSSGG